jgi:hypothetical protein
MYVLPLGRRALIGSDVTSREFGSPHFATTSAAIMPVSMMEGPHLKVSAALVPGEKWRADADARTVVGKA